MACQLPEQHGATVSRGHSLAARDIVDTDRLTVAGRDSHWLELSRKRSASGSCLSPHSSKTPSPGGGRSKHLMYTYILFNCSFICVLV